VLLGCSSSDGDAGESSTPGTEDDRVVRVVLLGAENEPLDYGAAQSYLPWVVLGNACDSLVLIDDGEPTLSLAESIEPDDEARAWTITIRDDAEFHDGALVTASDVAASLESLAESPGFAHFYAPVAGYDVVDEHTLVVELHNPRTDFVETVLSGASVITKDVGGDLPVCSGPFELTSFSSDTGAVLVANPDHWSGAPAIGGLEIRSLPDPTARVNALRSGAADFALDLPASAVAAVEGEPGLEVFRGGMANAHALYFVLNTQLAPLDDPEVRRALAMALDREQLVDLAIGPDGVVGADLFGNGLPGYATELEPRPTDTEAARDALADAGVSELTVLTAELTTGLTATAELLRQQMAEVGVQLEVEEVDPSVFFTDLERLTEAHIIPMNAFNRSPMAVIPQVFGDDNAFAFSGWYPPEFAELIEDARAESDEGARAQAITELQQLQWDQVPNLIWGYRELRSGRVAELDGVSYHLGVPLFGAASIDVTP
jgi:peptide/nickel transport system substrate-binding protein